MTELRKKGKMNQFDFCYGGGYNWVDMENNTIYYIQEYREAMDRGEHPDGIAYGTWGDPQHARTGTISEYALREKMKDPDPDPRY